jgi:hypothetical protein
VFETGARGEGEVRRGTGVCVWVVDVCGGGGVGVSGVVEVRDVCGEW